MRYRLRSSWLVEEEEDDRTDLLRADVVAGKPWGCSLPGLALGFFEEEEEEVLCCAFEDDSF